MVVPLAESSNTVTSPFFQTLGVEAMELIQLVVVLTSQLPLALPFQIKGGVATRFNRTLSKPQSVLMPPVPALLNQIQIGLPTSGAPGITVHVTE